MIRAMEYQSSEWNVHKEPLFEEKLICSDHIVYYVHPSRYQGRFEHNVPREHQRNQVNRGLGWPGCWPLSDQVQIRDPQDTSGCCRHTRKCSIQLRLGRVHVAEPADRKIYMHHTLVIKAEFLTSSQEDPLPTIYTQPHTDISWRSPEVNKQ